MITVYNVIPFSNPDLVVPGHGCHQWHDRNEVNIPVQGAPKIPYDVYYRTTWNRLEGDTENSWKTDWLDQRFADAISKKQSLRIGIMSVYTDVDQNTGGVFINGGWSAVPKYLITRMLAETPKCWLTGNTNKSWVINWNSAYYHARCLALNQWLNNYINTKVINNVRLKDVISSIDIRLYGNWGENHSAGIVDNVDQYPSGTFPTPASLIKIGDAHRLGFPDIPLTAMISGFDAHWLRNTWNPPDWANYLLTAKNNWGEFGWCRDNWGATDEYIDDYLIDNNRSFAGSGPFKNLIMAKWHKTIITGEPPGWNPDNSNYADLENQIRKYNATTFGDGNFGPTMNATIQGRVRAASKLCGFRFVMTQIETNVVSGGLAVNAAWQNQGNGNCWQNWDIEFFIPGTNWTAISKHKLKFFEPSNIPTQVIETLPLTGLAQGTYPLRWRVVDPNKFRVNMQIFIDGNDAAMSYSAGSITVGTVIPPPNVGPVADAGGDKEITLPNNNVQLIGSGSDPNQPANTLKYQWSKLSGVGVIDNPTAAITNISGLNTAGQSEFKLTVTDTPGASHSDNAMVKVNNPTIPPPVDKEIDNIHTNIENYVVTYKDGTTEVVLP